MKNQLLLTLLLSLVGSIGIAQIPQRILLLDGFLHVGNGEVIESAAIGIEGGTIKFVKNALAITVNESEWDTIIRLKGEHIYPGFVAPNSTLGLTEIDAVRATRDFNETGALNPHVRSQIAFNVESRVIATVRSNGVLITQATPRGGEISGSSSVMKMDGWNWEDATIKADDGVHINWPASVAGGGWWAEPAPKKRSEHYLSEKRRLYDFFELSQAYQRNKDPEERDQRLEAMKGCFDGTQRVYIHANELQQLLDVIEFAQYFDLKHPVIVGGYDSYLITRQLVDANIPIMVNRLHSLPEKEEDDVDLPYKLPHLLRKAGVKFCIQNEGDMEAMHARNLPFLGGTAVAYGLSSEDAISALSLWTCEIVGIDKAYGSIETGKSATLFVSVGDALDMRTNQVVLGLIDGKFIDLDNHQSLLYEKYKKKYE